jgi:hypothetical protein
MSSAVADVEVRLKFVDKDTSSGISRYLQRLERAARQTESTVNQANNRQRDSHERLSRARELLAQRAERAAQRETRQTESTVNQANSQQRGSHERLSRARELLAQRAERAAQRAVQQTEAAVNQASSQQRGSHERLSRARELLAQRAERAAQRAAQQTEAAVNQSNSQQRSSYDRLSHAREQLGVRPERAVRREIQQTEAAYRRLESSGTMSQSALAKAAEKTKAKITQLTNEMGKLTAEQKKAAQAAEQYEKIQKRINGGVAAGAGLAAAAYALKSPAEKAIAFDDKMLDMANTAFRERDARGRTAGAKELEAVVNKSVDLKQGGGGTREQAAEALQLMINKGDLGLQRSMDTLPMVMRTASGNNASPVDIANLSNMLVGRHVVKDDAELKTALNMITASGQEGSFEIKDLAKWLPQQLPTAQNAGMVGLDGLKKLLIMNQSAMTNAAGTDQAGNNVVNLLGKLTSTDTAKDFLKKSGRGDMAEYLVKERMKGVDSASAWLNLIDQESEKSPLLKQAMKKLKTVKNKDEQAALIEAISHMVEGSVIGEYFQDVQARGALFGLRNKDVVERVGTAVEQNRTEYGANDVNWQTKAQGVGAKLQNAEQLKDREVKSAMDRLTPTIGKVADMFVDLSTKYPLLSTAVVTATPPLTALAAAAGLSALALGGGRGGAGGGIDGYLGKAGSFLGKSAGALAGWSLGYEVLGPMANKGVNNLVKWGTGDPNQNLGGWLYDKLNPNGPFDSMRPPATSKSEPQAIDATANLNIGLAPGLVVQRQTTQSNGLNMSTSVGNTGNVWKDAPG